MNPPDFTWRAGRFSFEFPRPTVVMGIINVTPDSFSDGGRFLDPNAAVAHGLELVRQGAGILDVGGESTRPGAQPVSAEEEMQRVLPVVTRLVEQTTVPVSIDTMKPAVARAALDVGASIINDVAANREHPREMWDLVAESGAGYVCMHMLGTPRTMQNQPSYRDVTAEVHEFFLKKLTDMMRAGVGREQILLDIWLGFGKTAEHNLQLLRTLEMFRSLQRPLLVGASRKSFIGKLLGGETLERLPGSLACACWAVLQGVQFVRTHDVTETVQAIRICEAIADASPTSV